MVHIYVGATSFRILYWVGVRVHALEYGSAIPLFLPWLHREGQAARSLGFLPDDVERSTGHAMEAS